MIDDDQWAMPAPAEGRRLRRIAPIAPNCARIAPELRQNCARIARAGADGEEDADAEQVVQYDAEKREAQRGRVGGRPAAEERQRVAVRLKLHDEQGEHHPDAE